MNVPPPTSISARHHLKRVTAGQHAALDGGFGALDLKSRNDYRQFLAAQAAVIVPLEDWLTRHDAGRILPDWPRRRRAAALAEDLAGLGAGAGAINIVMGAPSVPAMLGVAYVLEGSRLGARYLSRMVAGSDDAAVRANMRFLTHGAGLPLWPSFLEILEARVTDAADNDEAARGARQAFAHFLAAQRRHASVQVDEVA
ncbi:MAG: biliverdin-producing heme oxygenase [Proteobacteria bacterium]|nr:biliverdin-producing heme oxygenase [Pseudomonadota bacterium]